MRSTYRVAPTRMFALTLALSSLAGCSKGPAPDGRRDTVRVSMYSAPVGEQDNESLSGAPSPLGGPFGEGVDIEYTNHTLPLSTVRLDEKMNDTALVSYLNKLIYDLNLENGQLILAPCTKNGNACVKGAAAPIFIQPEVGMNQLDVNSIDSNGVVVARLINYDTDGRMAKALHVPASSRAWWVVRRNSKKGLESLFIARDFANNGQVKIKTLHTATFFPCPGHTPDSTRASAARWWDCGANDAYAPRPRTKTAQAMSYLQFVSNRSAPVLPFISPGDTSRVRDGSTWITCSMGCCVAQ